MNKQQKNLAGFSFFFQAFAILLVVVAIIIQDWLSNPPYNTFYAYNRSWGLFNTVGRETRSHKNNYDLVCTIAAELSLGITSAGPLSNFYNKKCSAYKLIMFISYAKFIFLMFGILILLAATVSSLRKNIHSWKRAMALTILAIAAWAVAEVFYILMMSQAFAIINAVSYYPVPQISTSAILLYVAMFMCFLSFVLQASRFRIKKREQDFIEDTEIEALNQYENLQYYY